ncbi:retrovirus-related pol polyprotein from transposon TNT 1-94 [Tanacetum coccineum]
MLNSNTNLQTQTSNALHNAIMEASGKDRLPMLAAVPVAEGSSETTTEGYMENYKDVSQDIRDQLNAEAEAIQIILTGIDNDIYSIVDACPNACEIWKAIKRLKQGESINVQDLETNLYWEFRKFTSWDGETLESYYSRNREKAIVNSSAPIYDQEPVTVTEDDEMSKEKEIDKLMALISLSFKKIYKLTNNNLHTSSNSSRANQDNSLRINRGTGYDNKRVVNVAGARDNVEQADWKDDTDDESDDQELEAHYMYMAQIQEVTPDPVDNSGPIFDAEPLHKPVEIILFIVKSGCSKHMTENLKLLTNFVEKFLRTVKFGNDQIAPILGYGDLVQGTITIKRVYYVEGLNHNLFTVGQFCDADLEVAFRKSTCYIRDLKGNDLLTGSRGTDLYSITLQDTTTLNPICLMAKATSSQAWLWHRRLSHLNIDTINLLSKNNIVTGLPKLKFVKDLLCSSCELGKAKRKFFHTKTTPSSKRRLQLLHMDLCGLMQVESINGRKYVLVIVDDYSRYTWTYFLRDSENLDKMKEKGDACIFVGYSTQSKAYKVFNKRTRIIVETIHVDFDELPQMASDHVSSDPVPQVTTSNELELLYSHMFNELLNQTTPVVSKSSAVHAADNLDKRQQHNTAHTSTTTVVADPPPLNIQTTPQTTNQAPTQIPTATAPENIIQAETNTENA